MFVEHQDGKNLTVHDELMCQIVFIDDYSHPGRIGGDLDDCIYNLSMGLFVLFRGDDIEPLAEVSKNSGVQFRHYHLFSKSV